VSAFQAGANGALFRNKENQMSIFQQPDVPGQIKTSALPSGDMAVTAPSAGPLEQLMFKVCRDRGYRNPQGGWIVKSQHVNAARDAFRLACITVAE